MEKRETVFAARGGTRLRGWFYLPEGPGPWPGVVMAHGFSAVKEMCLPQLAEFLCSSGIAVLLYDHRNLGESDGEPRQEINPWAQTVDYRHALDWLIDQPQVDADRVGVYGSSFSGGEVLVLGSDDPRIRAVVANAPLAGMPGVDYGDTESGWRKICERLNDPGPDALASRPAAAPMELAVVSEPDGSSRPAFLPQEESARWFLRHGRRPGSTWQNEVTLANGFDCDPPFDPGQCVAHIQAPLLMVVATEDRLASTAVALDAFARAPEPKQLEMVSGDHFVAYEDEGFAQAAVVVRDFFDQYLGSKDSR